MLSISIDEQREINRYAALVIGYDTVVQKNQGVVNIFSNMEQLCATVDAIISVDGVTVDRMMLMANLKKNGTQRTFIDFVIHHKKNRLAQG